MMTAPASVDSSSSSSNSLTDHNKLTSDSEPSSLDQLLPLTAVSKYHFDTGALVDKLEGQGYSRNQSEALMTLLSEVIHER